MLKHICIETKDQGLKAINVKKIISEKFDEIIKELSDDETTFDLFSTIIFEHSINLLILSALPDNPKYYLENNTLTEDYKLEIREGINYFADFYFKKHINNLFNDSKKQAIEQLEQPKEKHGRK